MLSKAKIKSLLLDYSGLTYYQWVNLSSGIYIFNYHRVGNALATPFDPNVFSCNEEQFEQHLSFYKNNFDMLHMDELSEALAKGRKGKFGLITFDDGYIDNYQLAFPLLKQEKLSAAFYVPTDYIDSRLIPWWDEVAFMVRLAGVTSVQLSDGVIDVDKQNIRRTVRLILNQFKKDIRPVPDKLQVYRELLKPTEDMREEQLFMNWSQLSEMQQAGMTIGSHTCSHNILSHLSEEQQRYELAQSKALLEQKLGQCIKTIAYPVGGFNCYTEKTCELAKHVGYDFAFTFTNLLNRLDTLQAHAISRIGIDDDMSAQAIKRKIAFSAWI